MKKLIIDTVIVLFAALFVASCNNTKDIGEAKLKDSSKAKSPKDLATLFMDFENNGNTPTSHSSGIVYAFTDENENPKGTSTINELVRNSDMSTTLKPQYEKGKGALNSNGYLKMSGKVTTSFPQGFVGFGIIFTPDKQAMDISQFKGIKFWARGNGINFIVRLETPLIKDYAFHGCEFFADDEWEEFIIPFENFRQPRWKSKQVSLNDILKLITSIQWQTNSRPIENYSLCLDNIEFIK